MVSKRKGLPSGCVLHMGSDPGCLGRKGVLDLAVTVGAFQERPVQSC